MATPIEANEYLTKRGVKDTFYRSFLLRNNGAGQTFTLCSTIGVDYMVSHFLDLSERCGYGLIVTNKTLGTISGDTLVIGLIEGDDVICMDIPSGSISIWMIQSGNGEQLKVADSFKEFLAGCCQ